MIQIWTGAGRQFKFIQFCPGRIPKTICIVGKSSTSLNLSPSCVVGSPCLSPSIISCQRIIWLYQWWSRMLAQENQKLRIYILFKLIHIYVSYKSFDLWVNIFLQGCIFYLYIFFSKIFFSNSYVCVLGLCSFFIRWIWENRWFLWENSCIFGYKNQK